MSQEINADEKSSLVAASADSRFTWTEFYEAMADSLLKFKDNRHELIQKVNEASANVEGFPKLPDHNDICPFTVLGLFNRSSKNENQRNLIAKRITVARKLAGLLNVADELVPVQFDGVPTLPYVNPNFFDPGALKPGDIDALWDVFVKALNFAKSDNQDTRSALVDAFDNAMQVRNVGWNLTMGLYWIRPWIFPTLDENSRKYINQHHITLPVNGKDKRCNGVDYLNIIDILKNYFQNKALSVHSFPELSFAAWDSKDNNKNNKSKKNKKNTQKQDSVSESNREAAALYTIKDIIEEGCFIEEEKLERILNRLLDKKNIILQGPPGTGKTWLAKRLAFALIKKREESKIRVAQFHPNLSYEDFIRGWRPGGDGKLVLEDGPLMQIRKEALDNPDSKYVFVIEEINRGNPAQIFGEMLTLLEADKRNEKEAIELCYKKSGTCERVFLPENLYIIGTMNIADRSLALVDLALRRRFSFFDLEPVFGQVWRKWVHKNSGIPEEIIKEIGERLDSLNKTISNSLGPQFRIGHSYVTPASIIEDKPEEWFRDVVETDIGPLLDEYWFDQPKKAKEEKANLLKDLANHA